MATKAEYNSFVQEVQEFALGVGAEWRFHVTGKPTPEKPDARETSRFELYWDGAWQALGHEENPLSVRPAGTGHHRPYAALIFPEKWDRIKAKMADSITRS